MIINGKEYKINRENSVIRDWDKVYCNLLKKILKQGELFENRTGIDTLSIEGVNFKLDIGKDFPILESKKVNIKNALSELLWIYQAQTNEVQWLRDRGNNIWNEWEVRPDGYWYATQNVPDGKGGYEKKQISKYFGPEYVGTIGTAYGFINATFKRPQYVLKQLKENPHDRRMNIVLWQDQYLDTAVLPSCVWSSEWKVNGGKLHAYVHQRSADTPLGLPFNVSQYAILQAMFAKVSGLEVGNLNWSIMDAHIYVNQIEGIKLQLERFNRMKSWEKIIQKETDEQLQARYDDLKTKEAEITVKMNSAINPDKYKEVLRKVSEEIKIFELMVTKEKAILELADKDDFFSFNNNVNNDEQYLKENMTGNEDIKIKKYSSAPFIKMPIAQ